MFMAEKVYTIPLRKSLVKAPRGLRNRRANSLIKQYVSRHAKVKEEIGRAHV